MEYENNNQGFLTKLLNPFKESYDIYKRSYSSGLHTFSETLGEILDGPMYYLPFFILGFAITFFECFCSRRIAVFTKLTNKFNVINGDLYETSATNDYVYYHTENVTYPFIKDPLFGFSHQCGRLERKVQYCQWVQVTHSKTRTVGNETVTEYYYTYHKSWLNHQVSSLLYHDPLYWNPQVETIPELSLRDSDIKAGAYTISRDMTLLGSNQYYSPESYQIREFEERNALPDFQYAGKGIFYSTYKRGFLDQLLRVAQFADLKGDVVDWCIPGDRRVWFETWEPTDVTVTGLRLDRIIKPFNYLNYKVGSVHSGEVTLLKAVMGNVSSFPTIMKWILRIAAIAYFVMSCFDDSRRNPDFVALESTILCIVFGIFVPISINKNVFMNILLAFCGGLYVFEIKNLEFSLLKFTSSKNKYDEKKMD